MSNTENALHELIDVVEHLVTTHVRWNQDLSHAEAVAKLAAARTHVLAGDVVDIASDVEEGDAVAVVQDGTKTVGDVVNMVKTGE